MSNSKQGLVRNIASLGVMQIANYVLPLLSVPVISRIIGPDKFGVINFASSFMAYFTLLIGFGFDLSATRQIAANPNDEENRNRVFSEVFGCQLFLLGLSVVIFTICLLTVPQLRAESAVAFFSFLICISTVLTQNWLFQAMQDLSKVAILNIISKLVFTVLVLLAIRQKGDYGWYPVVFNGVNIIIAAISFAWALNRYKIRLVAVPFRRLMRHLWEEKTVFLSLVVINVYTTTNVVILGFYTDASQVGYYASAQRLIAVVQSLLTMPLYQAFYPYIGKAFGESREKGMLIVRKLVPMILLFTGASCLALYLLGPWILVAFYGEKFAPAVAAIRIMAFLPMIVCINNVYAIQVMLNLKMDKYFLRVTGVAAVLSIGLNMLLLPHLGYRGSAYTTVITELFVNLSMYFILRNKQLNPLKQEYFSPSVLLEAVRPLRDKLLRR
ncbi:MAG TPA: flippase [Puia sp.]